MTAKFANAIAGNLVDKSGNQESPNVKKKRVNPRRSTIDESSVIDFYNTGATIAEVGRKFCVTDKVIVRILTENGITTENRKFIRGLPFAEIASLYADGVGAAGVAKKFNISASVIIRLLRENGVHIRNASEQQQARMDRTPFHERQRLAEKANAAVRGVPKKRSESIKMARTSFLNGTRRSSPLETRLAEMLLERGIESLPQYPVGPYNCDLACPPVAVEVLGGKWHWHGEHRARAKERTYYFLDRDWHVLYVPIDTSFPLNDAVADYVANFIKFARGNPSATREYRVVWGAGEFVVGGCLDEDEFTFDPPFTSRRNPTNGRYERVPR